MPICSLPYSAVSRTWQQLPLNAILSYRSYSKRPTSATATVDTNEIEGATSRELIFIDENDNLDYPLAIECVE
jgi:hypothetical protein